MRSKLIFTLMLAVALGSTSCNSTKNLGAILQTLMGNDWELSSLLGQAVSADGFMNGLPSLNFEDGGKLLGSTGCNRMNGSFNLSGKSISLDPGAVTKMACPGDGEGKFLNALGAVNSFKLAGDELTLLDGAKELLGFAPKK